MKSVDQSGDENDCVTQLHAIAYMYCSHDVDAFSALLVVSGKDGKFVPIEEIQQLQKATAGPTMDKEELNPPEILENTINNHHNRLTVGVKPNWGTANEPKEKNENNFVGRRTILPRHRECFEQSKGIVT